MGGRFTHLKGDGSAHMVGVGAKAETARVARAQAIVSASQEVLKALADGSLAKGDALAVARIAGITAAKNTAQWIPLCHPIRITGVDIDITLSQEQVTITSEVRCQDRTGVEMEALTAASAAALTIYDMCKAVDKAMVIGPIKLLEKRGGRSGHWKSHSQLP